MNKILKSLYEQGSDTHLNTPKCSNAVAVFYVRNDAEKLVLKQVDRHCDALAECVNAESEQAFCAGFQTAVQLLMGGVQS